MECLYKFFYSLTTVVGLILGLFVISKNPRSRVNVTWALTSLAVAFWSLEMRYIFEPNYERALFGARLADYAAVFIPVFFTHFCLALLNKRLRESYVARAGYAFAIGMGGFFLTPWFVPSVSPKLFFRYYADPGPLFVVFTIQFFTMVTYAHWLLFRHLHEQPRERQNQIKYVASGTMLGYLCGSTTFLLAYGIPFNPWPSLFTSCYAVLITFAIARHHLMDITIVVTRTGVLLVTYMVVLGIPFVVGWWGHGWLQQRIGERWWLVPLGLCTALATIGPFAYAFLRRQAEARLLSEQRRYQRTLQLAARGMTRVRSITVLSNLMTRLVHRTVRVTHASLLLWDPVHQRYAVRASHGPRRLSPQSWYGLGRAHPLTQWLQKHRCVLRADDLDQDVDHAIAQELSNLGAALVIPGMIGDELVGFMVLGPKLSGAGYSEDDLHAFATLANEAAIAIENAISYEELLKANEQLKAASARLLVQERQAAACRFATGMAHEIKNPLSAIKTFAQFLPEKHADPAFRKKFFRIVQEEIDRINAIVKDLSDFAKPSPLELQPVKVCALVQGTLALLSDQSLKQGVEIRTDFQENGLTIQADPQQLKQVLLNLLLNSLEAMGQGGRLRVGTHATPSRLILTVADTGCGIPPDRQQDIWDPFFTTKERGMGLGLAIVKSIVERHGGELRLSSQPGKGTVVEVSLPVAPTSGTVVSGEHGRLIET